MLIGWTRFWSDNAGEKQLKRHFFRVSRSDCGSDKPLCFTLSYHYQVFCVMWERRSLDVSFELDVLGCGKCVQKRQLFVNFENIIHTLKTSPSWQIWPSIHPTYTTNNSRMPNTGLLGYIFRKNCHIIAHLQITQYRVFWDISWNMALSNFSHSLIIPY